MTASTQRQALNALVFLYKHVLDIQLEEEIAPARSKRVARPPTVMTQSEVQRMLAAMEGKPALMAKLIYGRGLRLMECIRLRVHDLLGHADVKTTEIYTHVMARDIRSLQSPLDRI